MRRIVYAAVLLLCISAIIHAQLPFRADSVKTYHRLDASYIFGGQIYNNNFIYKPGFSFQTTYGIRVNESASIGLGLGYYTLKDEHFVPIFIEAMGCRKKRESSPVINMQIGYSPAWYTGKPEASGYKFKGGIYLEAGLGRKFTLKNNYDLYFHWSYRHQFALMEFRVFSNQRYTESLNYDMFVISVGIIRRCQ
jgi:hypothetical protein